MIGYEYHVLIFKYNKILFLHLMNIININLEHCFGITKLSQKLNFAGENVVLIYAPNGLMKTSFARTMQLYGQGKADKVKDVVANIDGTIVIKDEQDNVVLPTSLYVSNCEEPDSETPKNITSFLADNVLKQQYDNILKNLSEKQKALFRNISNFAISSDIVLSLSEHSVMESQVFSMASLRMSWQRLTGTTHAMISSITTFLTKMVRLKNSLKTIGRY